MLEYSPDNEPALIKSIAEGDADAFSVVYHYYSKTIYNTVMTYLKNEAEAEEIVQQVFVKMWMRRATLSGVRSFRDYFFIIVRNSVFDYFNRLSQQARLADMMRMQAGAITAESTDVRLRQKQYDQLVEKAIGQLPARQKEVYLLAELEALDYDAIAGRMQISRLTAKKHMELARKSVRDYIGRYLKDDSSPLLAGFIIALLTLIC
ncbi:MAG TPA: sigma-70 family RNA polymerase sigma factor [Puia sp.]|nr:sigma-70 family RNA polymerase sigma factor [Puia sp.]